MGFKLAIGAGHYLGTAGRRVPAALDPASPWLIWSGFMWR